MMRKKRVVYKQIEPQKLKRSDCPCYRVLKFANRKAERCLKQVYSYERALSYIQEQKQATEQDILLPVLVCKHNGYIRPAKYEYVIVQRVDESNFCGYTLLRNNYGELVPHEVESVSEGSKTWKMVYKTEMLIEERFKVLGKNENLCCKEIYGTYLKDVLINGGTFCKTSILDKYVVIDIEGGNYAVICTKCKSEAVRLYNKLQELCNKDKISCILWCGHVNSYNKQRVNAIIKEFTN